METSAHWGTYSVETDGGEVSSARSPEPDASPAIGNVVSGNRHRSRIARPAVRRGDGFVEVPWDAALDLVAGELERVRSEFGNQAIFGGSYGWGSAGRLHHAQSQLHRFLNKIGGYTRSINDYSRGASQVLLPHLVGAQEALDLRHKPASWADIAEHTDLLVSFGGVRRSNTWVAPGGHARHTSSERIRAVGRTTRVVSLSAQRDDAFADLDAEWIGVMPATDTAVVLALIHVLVVDGLSDDEFLATHTVGAEQVRRYVLGEVDGVPKTPEWAAEISRAPANVIRGLAHRMAAGRTLINVVYALQRGENGEQPVFAALTLAAFLGQIGLPGGGFAHGFGSMGDYGVGVAGPGLPTFPQGVNPVPDFIPCARISDMLLHPGETIPYNGRTLTYPDVKLAYWAGGNPFHHHQDLRRLRTALSRLDTFVVHETHWTPTARHADVVLPVATTLERDDIAAGAGDSRLRAMPRVVEPFGEAREEFWIYTELASRLGVDFAEGLDSSRWLERIYEEWRTEAAPPFAEFWRDGGLDLPQEPYRDAVFTAFRSGSPLGTPSGRIELDSAVAGHARWREPTQWWGSPLAEEFDLHLLCNQPTHRLHSQLDMGDASQSTKVAGREPIRLTPEDAAKRGLSTGDIALVRSAQGSLLAGVVVTDVLLPGVAQMHTGAWFDPSAPEIADCVNGNVNVLTRDVPTSPLTQATSGAHVLVAVTRYDGPVPPVRAYDPPSTR